MTVAGEFYLIAHDDRTGRPRLHHRALEIGVAAAFLAEMISLAQINIADGAVWITSPQPPADAYHLHMRRYIEAERQPLRRWIEFFATNAVSGAIARLERDGELVRAQSRRMFRPTTTWAPSDTHVGARSHSRLSVGLRRGELLAPIDVALAGLVHATELDGYVLDGAEREAHLFLQAVIQGSRRPLRELVDQTRALLGAELLSRRM